MEGNLIIVNDSTSIYSSDWGGEYSLKELDYLNDLLEDLVDKHGLQDDKFFLEKAKDSCIATLEYKKAMNAYHETNDEGYLKKAKELKAMQKAVDDENMFSRKSSDNQSLKLTSFSEIGAYVEDGEYIYKEKPIDKNEIETLINTMRYVEKSIDKKA